MADNTPATATATATDSAYPNYQEEKILFRQFLQEYIDINTEDDDDDDTSASEPQPLYKKHLQAVKNRTNTTLQIYLADLIRWDAIRGGDLASRALSNTKRYLNVFSEVIDDELVGYVRQANPASANFAPMDAIDVLVEQRLVSDMRRREQQQQDGNGVSTGAGGLMNDLAVVNELNGQAAMNALPPALMRRYELQILPPYAKRKQSSQAMAMAMASKELDGSDKVLSMDKAARQAEEQGVSLRDIRSSHLGQLVTIKGMLVRASDVKPYCVVATYTCDKCGCEVYQEVKGKEFMPLRSCPSETCNPSAGNVVPNKKGETLFLQTRGSKFVKFQELKLQEIPSQVPIGHIPRCMPVHVHGNLTRSAMPGDVVTIDGIFLPSRAVGGYRSTRAGLSATTYLEASRITVHKKSYDERSSDNAQVDQTLVNEVLKIANSEDPVGRLARSIAPEIFGHEDVKRALLLQLVGGCERKLPDGMRIRGDINICMMGDPGVAKSQLLKYISSMAPRGV